MFRAAFRRLSTGCFVLPELWTALQWLANAVIHVYSIDWFLWRKRSTVFLLFHGDIRFSPQERRNLRHERSWDQKFLRKPVGSCICVKNFATQTSRVSPMTSLRSTSKNYRLKDVIPDWLSNALRIRDRRTSYFVQQLLDDGWELVSDQSLHDGPPCSIEQVFAFGTKDFDRKIFMLDVGLIVGCSYQFSSLPCAFFLQHGYPCGSQYIIISIFLAIFIDGAWEVHNAA